MYRDEIIAEVWRNRDAYVEKHHHNLEEIVQDIQKRQKTHHSKVVDRRRHRTISPVDRVCAVTSRSPVPDN